MTTPRLTIAYLTNRRQPHLHWFLQSLMRQQTELGETNLDVLVVDHFCEEKSPVVFSDLRRVCPKPNVWNGPHRLTKDEWFAAGSARNTALCLAKAPWIAFVDDLSVLMSDWLKAALAATTVPHTVTCGAYRKVKQLKVSSLGVPVGWEHFDGGVDNRQKHVDPGLTNTIAVPCGGQWLYGCSLVAPVEAFLEVNGWAEDISGGIGFEDVLTGLVLENAGYKFRYDTSLMSFESEEGHHIETPFKKSDFGVSPNDKSHKCLDLVKGRKRFDNGFNLRALRADVQSGKPFPIPTEPTAEWFTGTQLKDL